MNPPNPIVVVTDWTFPDLSVEEGILKRHGVELMARQCKAEADLIGLCADADAVITQFARLKAKVILAMRKARAIVRYGIGVDNVDLDAARERGIPVCNVPDYCIDEVADQTLAFILATTRQVVTHANHLRAGRWGLATSLAGMTALRDLTVGVAGFGRIGREVVKRLLPFKCAVQVFDPVVPATEIEKPGARAVSFEELLRNADVLTLHCPSTAQTRKLMNHDSFARLKPGAIFINVGRGDLADPEALTAALQTGRLGAAALDVFDPEPIPPGHPILTLPNVILSPHIASCSVPAVRKLREEATNLALAAVRGEALPNIVNGVKPRI
jgi:D-3-phosphoglycerate dehydrogenase